MIVIRMNRHLGADRQLMITIPDEIPQGEIELIIRSSHELNAVEPLGDQSRDLQLEDARAMLRDAGLLARVEVEQRGLLQQERMWELSKPLKPTPQSHEQIDEDRSAR
jgi:hypothetical protein